MGLGGHLPQIGNHLQAPVDSEEDDPSVMANARQVPAKLTLLTQLGSQARGPLSGRGTGFTIQSHAGLHSNQST